MKYLFVILELYLLLLTQKAPTGTQKVENVKFEALSEVAGVQAAADTPKTQLVHLKEYFEIFFALLNFILN